MPTAHPHDTAGAKGLEAEHLMQLDADRDFLAAKPRLPDAVTLARPLAKALRDIYDAFEDRATMMAFQYDEGAEYLAEADDLIDTANEMIAIARAVVDSLLAGEDRGAMVPALIDPILRAITKVDHLESIRVEHQHRNAFWALPDELPETS